MNMRSIPWVEPAHPSVIRNYEDLVAVYRAMKERQEQIDRAFDEVAAQIGFVVTTTIPVHVTVEQHGAVKSVRTGQNAAGHHVRKGLRRHGRGICRGVFGKASPGSYRFYLIWYDALALKLRRDWIEPAHVLQAVALQVARQSLSRIDVASGDPGMLASRPSGSIRASHLPWRTSFPSRRSARFTRATAACRARFGRPDADPPDQTARHGTGAFPSRSPGAG